MMRADLVIAGGGLAGGLCALALRQFRPQLRVVLVEPGERIGGNHLWSFFGSDVADAHRTLVDPLIGHRWQGYDVRFPSIRRTLDASYHTIESEALDRAVGLALPGDAIVRAAVSELGPRHIILNDGSRLDAAAVIDARGGAGEGLDLGWQKFVGQTLHIPAGHGLERPIVMDATVEQQDGYRFVYCLPFTATDVFVEDTYYSDTREIDEDRLRANIAVYAERQGWKVAGASREEHGALPVIIGGDFDHFWRPEDKVARAGARGGFFHPLTSYSLPDAVRFAHWLAREAPLDDRLGPATRALGLQHWRDGRYYRLLTAMLFRAAEPDQRYRVLQRFYRLSGPLIGRFYAGQSTLSDKLRILAGRPPVPLGRALRAIKDTL